jgi:thioredoxin-like negative regulator of GroEL
MSYEVVFDAESDVSQRFDVRTLPMVFLVDDQGTVLDVMRGFEPDGIRRMQALLDERR